MLKINLIPVKEKKRQKEIFVIIGLGILLILSMLSLSFYYLKKKNEVKNLETEIAQITEESKAYDEKIKEIKALEEKENSLNSFKGTIKSIEEIQRNIVVGVDQIAAGLPAGIWLTSISQKNGNDSNKYELIGYSFTQVAMDEYLEYFKRPGTFISDPNLDIRSTTLGVGSSKKINQFALTIKVLENKK